MERKQEELCGKLETIQRAIKSGELSEKDRIECRALKMKMRKREPDNSDIFTKSLIAKKRRGILGAIEHNQRSQKGSLEKPIVMLESESEEEEASDEHNYTRGLMNLLTLTREDRRTIEGRVNDACINALSDVLHKQVKKDRISICHTQWG
jgi:hypothetical protein